MFVNERHLGFSKEELRVDLDIHQEKSKSSIEHFYDEENWRHSSPIGIEYVENEDLSPLNSIWHSSSCQDSIARRFLLIEIQSVEEDPKESPRLEDNLTGQEGEEIDLKKKLNLNPKKSSSLLDTRMRISSHQSFNRCSAR